MALPQRSSVHCGTSLLCEAAFSMVAGFAYVPIPDWPNAKMPNAGGVVRSISKPNGDPEIGKILLLTITATLGR
jgi:hypothetical protein